MEGDNFVDGRIPQANISSYNSHQSNKKLAFQAKLGQIAYASNGSTSNPLEETCVMSTANNLVMREDLRNTSRQQTILHTQQEQQDESSENGAGDSQHGILTAGTGILARQI